MSIDLNSKSACVVIFSSDRKFREYCQQIWQVEPVPIELEKLEAYVFREQKVMVPITADNKAEEIAIYIN